VTDALGGVTRYEHDALGNLLRSVDANGDAIHYGYDVKGRLTDCVMPGQLAARYEFDAQDNLIGYRDPAGQTTRFGYFGQGCLAYRTEPDGSVVQYHYDTEERLVGVSNALGQTWQLQHDAAGRLVGEIDYYGQTQRYAYDAAGHLTQTVDPLGRVLAVRCNALGLVIARDSDAGDYERFAYNRRGQLTEASNEAGIVRREYDADGRVIREMQQHTHLHGMLDYTYDAAGRLRSQRRQMQGVSDSTPEFVQTLAWRYDALGNPRLLQIDAHEPIRFSHDPAGRLVDIRFGGGLQQRQEYDDAGRLGRRTVSGAGQRADFTAFAYDPVGNLTARFDSRLGEDTYRYDPLGRIREHMDPAGRMHRFVCDAHGDRFATLSATPDGRVLRHPDGVTWRLDAAGQLTERHRQDVQQRFEWDAFGRLRRFDDGCGERGAYEYDALGRRVAKVLVGRDRGAARIRVTGFVWDGDAMAGEARFTSDELNASGQQSLEARFYVYQQNSFEPLAMEHQPFATHEDGALTATGETVQRGQLYYYQNDLNGAPVRLRDRDGEVVWEAHYSVTGTATDRGARWFDQPLRLQGQYLDGETGLHYNCHRYYDPEQASFISSDPVALAGGINVYQYAPNPISWIDPLGLTSNCFTSRAARREAMRQASIPVSQQPISQSRNASGREYRYEVPNAGGGSILATVQQQTMDVSHLDDFHWEAGKVKINPINGEVRLNDYGRPKIANPKGKVYYGNNRQGSAA